jgi:hypothetical protein
MRANSKELAFEQCVSEFFDKIPDMNNLKEKRFIFGSHFLDVSVHSHWLHCFWACGKAGHHGGRAQWGRYAHLMTARKQKEKEEEARARYTL